jgi:PAS domain S-box-containing protein
VKGPQPLTRTTKKKNPNAPGDRGRTWYRFGLPGLFFVISAFVVVYLLTDVRAKMGELESSPFDNVQWTLTQLEVEYLTFAIQVERADALNYSDPLPPDLGQLRRRYDILYSRVQTIRDGTLYDPAVSGGNIEEDFQRVADEIFGLAELIDQTDAALLADLPEMRARLDALHPSIRRILTIGNRGLALNSDTKRKEISSVLIRLAEATGVLLVTLTMITLLFRREAAVSDNRLKENLASSARLEAIFSTSRDAIVVFDQAGHVLNLNRAGEEMFGTRALPESNARIYRLLAKEESGRLLPITGRSLFDAARSGRQSRLRLTGFRQTGAEFPVEISIDISTLSSRPICVAVIRDISHQVEVEQELKQSRDTARAGERAKARFLGVVSHEMRTPLNGILGAIELIEAESQSGARATESFDTYFPVIKSSAKSLVSLVDDVLDLTQIEGGPKLSLRPFDLDALLDEIVLAAEPSAQQLDNSLTLVRDTPLGWVRGDPDRIRQIITNLVANAIKFTRAGEIAIEVARGTKEVVEIQVMDTGMGMTADELAHIFDDFFRADTAIRQQIKGTGLGLGITRSLVDAMDGEIGAESEEGEGSVFWLRLPLPPVAQDEATKTRKTRAPDLPRARILLVEDNATNRLIARRLLELEGHIVTEAVNGADCLDHCATAAFDLILMDISMPVIDGPTAAHHIRQGDGPNKATRIVALTAHMAGALDMSEAMRAMDAILHKPLDRQLLYDQISLALGIKSDSGDRLQPSQLTLSALLGALPAETATKLIDAFLSETDRDLPNLLNAAATARSTPDLGLAEALHALAGAAASLGIAPLHRALANAEQSERAGQTEKTARLVSGILDQWPEIRAEITDLRPGPLSSDAQPAAT